jgi:hypothetical protein
VVNVGNGDFERYYVDVRTPGGEVRFVRQLAERGFATFDSVGDRDSLLELARPFVDIVRHRDSDPDGVTIISGHDKDLPNGFAGFSRTELLPHSEGSSLPWPPALLLLVCVAAADAGGESSVLDAKALYEALAVEDPGALRALATPGSACFGDGAGHLGSVFEEVGTGRIGVRLRLDNLGRFSPDATDALSKLRSLMHGFRVEFRMNAGQGFALQNGRWLHGRTSFAGHREMLRILGNPLSGVPLQFGFTRASVYSLSRS